MTLEQAVKMMVEEDMDWFEDDFDETWDIRFRTAIATILNAVVKGELVAVGIGETECVDDDDEQEWTAGEKKMWFIRNGHNEQAPWEDREDHNLRVYGLREEDIE